MNRRFVAYPALALLALASSCTVEKGLLGLPLRTHEDVAAEAQALLGDVEKIEAHLETEYGPRATGHDPEFARRYHGYRAALEAQLALAVEHFDYRVGNQRARLGRPPMVLYPRAISPCIPKPVTLPADGGGSEVRWFIPIVIGKHLTTWSEHFGARWFGAQAEPLEKREMPEKFKSFLVPHGGVPGIDRNAKVVQKYFVHLPDLEVPLPDGHTATLPDFVEERATYVIAPVMAGSSAADAATGIEPGFYDLRMFPVLDLAEAADADLQKISAALGTANWYEAARRFEEQCAADPHGRVGAWHAWLKSFKKALRACEVKWFEKEIDALEDAVEVALAAEDAELKPALLELEQALRRAATVNRNLAPVLLEAPREDHEPFSFIVCADLQYSGDATRVRQFLGMLDESFLPNSRGGDVAHLAEPSGTVMRRVREAKFVVVVGDLSDGAALSSTPFATMVNVLGVAPPSSPYGDDFVDLQQDLAQLKMPVFAVPGNHDGFANYGGFFNEVFAMGGDVFQSSWIPRPLSHVTHPVGELLHTVGSALPTLFKLGRISHTPYYDGLTEWRHRLGPVHFAFRYRDHTFLGLNSFNLDVRYRDQIGPLANTWGGGIERHDALWFDFMLRWSSARNRREAPGKTAHQFAFMHHDPRASRPVLRSYEETLYGRYDVADTPMSTLTFGYFGLSWSPHNPLWLPIITPLFNYLPRWLLLGEDRFNQEWMMSDPVFDADHCGARQLVESITRHLRGGEEEGSLSHLFLGHDDLPAVSQWIHEERGHRVFPAPSGGWPSEQWRFPDVAIAPFYRLQTDAPPAWGRKLAANPGANAVVMRCDDVGQSGSMHGFHLVTVEPTGVVIEWVHIPG